MKNVLEPDHYPLNKFKLVVLGLAVPELTLTSLTGLEEELDVVDLPDRTVASGGRTSAIEFEISIPLHHEVEQKSAMELWFQEGQDPVSPTYKKPGTLILESISGERVRSFSMPDLFPAARNLPDFEMDNDGEMAMVTWKMRCSDVLAI